MYILRLQGNLTSSWAVQDLFIYAHTSQASSLCVNRPLYDHFNQKLENIQD